MSDEEDDPYAVDDVDEEEDEPQKLTAAELQEKHFREEVERRKKAEAAEAQELAVLRAKMEAATATPDMKRKKEKKEKKKAEAGHEGETVDEYIDEDEIGAGMKDETDKWKKTELAVAGPGIHGKTFSADFLKTEDRDEKFLDDVLQKLVGKLPDLTQVSLAFCIKISDAGVRPLATCKNMTVFNISGLKLVSDQAIAHVCSAMPNLSSANISCCQGVGDETLKALSGAANLQYLNASRDEKITDDGFRHIGTKCRKIAKLDLSACYQLTPASIRLVTDNFANIRELKLTGVFQCKKIPEKLELILATNHATWENAQVAGKKK